MEILKLILKFEYLTFFFYSELSVQIKMAGLIGHTGSCEWCLIFRLDSVFRNTL